MPFKVLVYSRFPKAMMVRIGERFELLHAAGKLPTEVFTADELSGVQAMITAGGTPLPAAIMDMLPKLAAIVCYGTGYDGVDIAAANKRSIAVANSPTCTIACSGGGKYFSLRCAYAYPANSNVWKNTMQVVQTAGLPPNQGRMNLLMIGCTSNSSSALASVVKT